LLVLAVDPRPLVLTTPMANSAPSCARAGAWNEWIEFFVQGVKQQCFETIKLTQRILQLREELHQAIGDVRRRASLSAVLDAFFYDPTLYRQEIQQRANISSYHTVRSALKDLGDQDMVYEITGRQRGKVYACIPVLDAIFGVDN
jgi:Fic family protein